MILCTPTTSKLLLTGVPLLTRQWAPRLNAERLYGALINTASLLYISVQCPYANDIDEYIMVVSQALITLMTACGMGTTSTSAG